MNSLLELHQQPHTLAVIGSRSFGADSITRHAMGASLHEITRVVSGGARGVDATAETYARQLGLGTVSYRPVKESGKYAVRVWIDGEDWGLMPNPKTGDHMLFPDFRAAALRRNWWIVRVAARVLALWDGQSTGTAHGIAVATRLNRDLRIWMDGDS